MDFKFNLVKPDDKINQIFDATVKCILKHGAQRVTMRSIAAEANVSQALLHYYFKNRENLLLECTRNLFDILEMKIKENVERGLSPVEMLEKLLAAGQQNIERHSDLFIVVQEIWALAIRNPEIMKGFKAHMQRMSAVVRKILVDGEREGVFRRMERDSEVLAALYLTQIIGLGVLWQVDRACVPRAYSVGSDMLRQTIVKAGAGKNTGKKG